jgi:hypothetical protein
LLLRSSSGKARGFELVEQMPCLNLNGHSTNPENDLMTRLNKPTRGVRDMAEIDVGAALLKVCEQFGITCGKALSARRKSLSPHAQVTGGRGENRLEATYLFATR